MVCRRNCRQDGFEWCSIDGASFMTIGDDAIEKRLFVCDGIWHGLDGVETDLIPFDVVIEFVDAGLVVMAIGQVAGSRRQLVSCVDDRR